MSILARSTITTTKNTTIPQVYIPFSIRFLRSIFSISSSINAVPRLLHYTTFQSKGKYRYNTQHNTRDTIMVYDRDTLEPLHGLTP